MALNSKLKVYPSKQKCVTVQKLMYQTVVDTVKG